MLELVSRSRVAEKSYTYCAISQRWSVIFFYEILNHSIRESHALFITHSDALGDASYWRSYPSQPTLPAQTNVKYRLWQKEARHLHAFNAIYCIIVKSDLYISFGNALRYDNLTGSGFCNHNEYTERIYIIYRWIYIDPWIFLLNAY